MTTYDPLQTRLATEPHVGLKESPAQRLTKNGYWQYLQLVLNEKIF
jgi:hypothetical protein